MRKNYKTFIIAVLVGLLSYSNAFCQIFPKEKKGKWALVEKRKKLTEYLYDEIEDQNSAYFTARKGSKWGVLNSKGQLIVPLIYDDIEDYQLGFLIVDQEKKKGVIDTANRVLVDIKYDDIDSFGNDSKALVNKSGIWFYVENNQRLDRTDIIFKNPDKKALFIPCENCSIEEANKQSELAIIKFIATNIRYPEVASKNGVQGVIVISFIINEDGKISNPTIVRDIGANCGEAGVKVINQMPTWAMPAIQNQQKVKSEIIMPIRLKLD